VQTPTDQPAFTIETRKGPVTLRPRYRFEISAVVAGAERYWLDGGAFLSPLDLTLVWGDLPAEPYWNQVHYTQTGRYYLWGTASPELDLAYIPEHSSNMHMIPADANVRATGSACAASSSTPRDRTASPGRPRRPARTAAPAPASWCGWKRHKWGTGSTGDIRSLAAPSAS
jgi:hypothetical protein